MATRIKVKSKRWACWSADGGEKTTWVTDAEGYDYALPTDVAKKMRLGKTYVLVAREVKRSKP